MDNKKALLLPKRRFGESNIETNFAYAVAKALKSPFSVLCVGSDRRLSDCFGPVLGSMLIEATGLNVYGTLDKPVHKENLLYTLDKIRSLHPSGIILTVDAAMSETMALGDILFSDNGIRAASAFNNYGVLVGDISLVGVTEVKNARFPIRLIELYEMANAAFRILNEAFALAAKADF